MTQVPIFSDKTIATMRPYKANASAKIRMRIIPTYNFGCCPPARTPESPTIPIAIPAARPLRPHDKPAARWAKPVKRAYSPGLMFVERMTAMINPYIPITLAIATGMIFFMTSWGCITPIAAIPTPLLAVPYAAPRFENTRATVTPMKPKKGADTSQRGASARRTNILLVLFLSLRSLLKVREEGDDQLLES
eukprot:1022073_1